MRVIRIVDVAGIATPCAAEVTARNLHFKVDLVFLGVIAENFDGKRFGELPGIPGTEFLGLIRFKLLPIASFFQPLPSR